jgi:uncharacterized protein (TIGR02147 family)
MQTISRRNGKQALRDTLFSYTDYRRFLRDYFNEKKRLNRVFSLKLLADRAGFKARDYLLRVMNGSRNLSQSGVCMLSQALGLSEKEADYFANLVGFNQAKIPKEKEFFYDKMSNSRKYGHHQRLRSDQFESLSEWYYCAIRSLLPIIDFKDDFAALARFLDPPLSAAQAKKAVEVLLRLGLIQCKAPGRYEPAFPAMTTGDEVSSVALMRFHKQSLDLARRALEIYPSDMRDVSGVTMSLSAAGYGKIREEISRFRKRVMDVATADSGEEAVFQLNLQLFPLSKRKAR